MGFLRRRVLQGFIVATLGITTIVLLRAFVFIPSLPECEADSLRNLISTNLVPAQEGVIFTDVNIFTPEFPDDAPEERTCHVIIKDSHNGLAEGSFRLTWLQKWINIYGLEDFQAFPSSSCSSKRLYYEAKQELDRLKSTEAGKVYLQKIVALAPHLTSEVAREALARDFLRFFQRSTKHCSVPSQELLNHAATLFNSPQNNNFCALSNLTHKAEDKYRQLHGKTAFAALKKEALQAILPHLRLFLDDATTFKILSDKSIEKSIIISYITSRYGISEQCSNAYVPFLRNLSNVLESAL